MNARVRDNVPAVAAVLSAVSLALVIGTAAGLVPGRFLPRVEPLLVVIPHLNAVLSAAAIVVILAGLRAIRRGDVARHRRAMLTGLGLFAGFLVLYLYRVAVLGPTHFDGPAWLATFVYRPILAVHILLAVVCVPLLYYVVLLGLTRPVPEISTSAHPRVGRVTVLLWLISFGLGLVVYTMLYWLF
jgi:putative membrane protein